MLEASPSLNSFRAALLDVVSDALTHGEDGAFYQRLLERAVPIIPGAQAGSIFSLEPSGNYRICAAVGYDLAGLREVSLTLDELAPTIDAQHYEPYLARNFAQLNRDVVRESARRTLNEVGRAEDIKVALSVPVMIGPTMRAVLFFDNFDKVDAFGEEAIRTAQIFGAQLGVVLQRLAAQRRTETWSHFQQHLMEVANTVLADRLDESFYQQFIDRAVQAIPGAEGGSVLVRREDGAEPVFCYVAARGYDLGALQHVSYTEAELRRWHHNRAGAPQLVSYRSGEHDADTRSRLLGSGRLDEIEVTLAAPVILEGRLEALINLESFSTEHAFSEETVQFAEVLAKQVGVVLRRLQLQREAERQSAVHRSLSQLERLLLAFGSLEDFFPLLAKLLLDAPLGVEGVAIYRLTPSHRLEVDLYGLPREDQVRVKRALEQGGLLDLREPRGFAAHAALRAQPIYSPDLTKEPTWVDLGLVGEPGADAAEKVDESLIAATSARACLLHPLKQRSALWGMLSVTSRKPHAFDALTHELISQVASSVELALAKEAEREGARVQLEKMNALVAANEALRSAASFAEVYESTTEMIVSRTAASSSSILRFDVDRDIMTVVANRSRRGECAVGQELPRGRGVSWHVLMGGRPLSLENVYADDNFCGEDAVSPAATALETDPFAPSSRAGGTPPSHRSGHYIGCPLMDSNGEIIGVLSVWGDAKFSQSDVAFTEAVAQSCTGALVRLGLVGKTKREARAYRALANFGETIEEINDVGALMELGLTSLSEQIGMDMATYYDIRDDLCHPIHLYGSYPERLELVRAPIPIGEGLAGRVARTGEVAFVSDYRAWPHALPAYTALGVTTLLVIPVKQRGEVVKVIALCCFFRSVHISEEQLTVARNFVKRLENALERADNLREVEATREATLRSLGLVLEYRDFETKGHTDRVMDLSLRLGKRLGFSKHELQALRWGAYLHDIGKVAIPDSILLKPGKLEDHEFEAIKEHTVIGHATCRDIPFLPQETREVVRSHHERWDGRGYPDKLAEEAIPLMARMFSLIDVYDALTSKRPYKEAWPVEKAVAEIQRGAGTQFDPALVPVFVEMCEENALVGP